MNKVIPLALTLIATTYLPKASAIENSDWYVGALYSSQDVSIYGREFSTLGGTIGYQYNEYISFETRMSIGVSGYSMELNGIDIAALNDDVDSLLPAGFIEHDIDSQISALMRLSYPITNNLNIYALAGLSSTKSSLKGSGRHFSSDGVFTDIAFDDSYTDTGFSYGVGGNYQFNARFSLYIDYQVLPEFDFYSHLSGIDSDAKDWNNINLGVNYTF